MTNTIQRLRPDGTCPVCGEKPKLDEGGYSSCVCPGLNGRWGSGKSIKGTPEQSEILLKHGFEEAEDIQGHFYYVGPFYQMVWLDPGMTGVLSRRRENLKAWKPTSLEFRR